MRKLMRFEELILERLSPKLKWDELTSILYKKLGFNISDLIYDVATEIEDEEMNCGFFISVENKNKTGFTGIITYDTKNDLSNPSSWVKHDKNINFLDIYKSSYRDDIRNMNFDVKIDITIYSKNGLDMDRLFEIIDRNCQLYNLKIKNDPRIKDNRIYHSDRFITLWLSK